MGSCELEPPASRKAARELVRDLEQKILYSETGAIGKMELTAAEARGTAEDIAAFISDPDVGLFEAAAYTNRISFNLDRLEASLPKGSPTALRIANLREGTLNAFLTRAEQDKAEVGPNPERALYVAKTFEASLFNNQTRNRLAALTPNEILRFTDFVAAAVKTLRGDRLDTFKADLTSFLTFLRDKKKKEGKVADVATINDLQAKVAELFAGPKEPQKAPKVALASR